jgi:hypothetical protein
MNSAQDGPILVTGAAGALGAIGRNLTGMTELNKQGRYDRMTDDLFKLTGERPTSMHHFVKRHAAEFTRREITA